MLDHELSFNFLFFDARSSKFEAQIHAAKFVVVQFPTKKQLAQYPKRDGAVSQKRWVVQSYFFLYFGKIQKIQIFCGKLGGRSSLFEFYRHILRW